MAEEGSRPPRADGDGAGETLDALARAAQRGDPRSRDRFARRLEPLVASSVRLQASPELLRVVGFEDVVQEVVLKIESELPRLEVRSEPALLQWIHKLVHHRICDLHDYHERAAKRDFRRIVPLADGPHAADDGEDSAAPASNAPSPDEAAILRELAQLALRALDRIPVDEASAVRRIALRGERIADVARELAVGESTVRMRLTRGLARIYHALGEA